MPVAVLRVSMRVSSPLSLLATALWAASSPAEAQDECETDEECVELYTEGFRCVSGSLGRYCLEEGCTGWECPSPEWGGPDPESECTTDDDCHGVDGEEWVCSFDFSGAGACVLDECDVDADCASLGPAFECVDWWGSASICERDWGYVPPFRSCTVAAPDAAPRDDGAALAFLGAAFAIAASRRRRV